jgi:hypothetical protein
MRERFAAVSTLTAADRGDDRGEITESDRPAAAAGASDGGRRLSAAAIASPTREETAPHDQPPGR